MAVISATSICNEALVFLGEEPILAFPETSPNSDRCETFYASTKERELAKHQWNFAVFREALTRDSTNPLYEYPYQFILPPKLLRILEVWPKDMPWKRENTDNGQRILTNSSTLTLKYLKSVDESQFSHLFAAVLSARLAFLLASVMTERSEKVQLAQVWYDSALTDALRVDSHESSVDQMENLAVVTDRWSSSDAHRYKTVVFS